MHLALDIDGTITAIPEFFALLSEVDAVRVTVITFRDDDAETRAVLSELGIRHHELVTRTHPEHGCRQGEEWEVWKARAVAELGVDVFFEDMPEVVQLVEPPTKVVMVCGDEVRQWLAECLKRV